MKEWQEFEGKSVSAAVQRACERLKLNKEALHYEVLSHGSSGIFGLVGARNARIRVGRPDRAETGVETGSDAPGGHGDPSIDSPPGRSHMTPDCQGGGSDQNPGELGREVLDRILSAVAGDATISVAKDDGRLQYDIRCGNQAVIIGKRGQTLEAIHYLVEKIVNRHSEQRIRIQVDVGGYLENRQAELRQLAVRMAKKAIKSGKPATVGQLNAHDRRIVHLELKDHPAVRTQSVGKGLIRNLVIFPKRSQVKRPKKTARSAGQRLGAE